MVEVKLVDGATHCAFATVSFPYLKLGMSWDNSTMCLTLKGWIDGGCIVLKFLDCFEAKFENIPSS
jgi:hypothetical protein